VAVRSEITDPRMQGIFDRIAQRVGSTDGRITREQYQASTQQFMASMGGGSPGGSPMMPSAQPGGGDWASMRAEFDFRRRDLNQDGVLNSDEMPEGLRDERTKWDANGDGFIDINEYKEYYRARMQQFMVEQAASGQWGGFPNFSQMPTEEEQKPKPTVYRAGALPPNVPAWFTEADTDRDAQIGLYEWRAKGWPIDKFLEMDRNNDGFLTVDEVLRAQGQSGNGGTQVASAQSPGGMPGMGMGNRYGGQNGGGPPGMGGPGSFRRPGGDSGGAPPGMGGQGNYRRPGGDSGGAPPGGPGSFRRPGGDSGGRPDGGSGDSGGRPERDRGSKRGR
jgi:hypothetical protein